MREARMKVVGERWVVHVLGRTALPGYVFGPQEKEAFRKLLWKISDFCGIGVLTYCLMGNHYHLLLDCPAPHDVPDDELLRRVEVLYGKVAARTLDAALKGHPDSPETEALKDRYLRKMGDLSSMMKLLLQRFGVWFNRRHRRAGTVWGDRFKSLIVEPTREAMEKVAAYIDLNPVRAGLVKDPKDYRWCGYAEALGGSASARAGLAVVLESKESSWTRTRASYRLILFGEGEKALERKGRSQATLPSPAVTETAQASGELSLPDLLRCRIRYFSDGAILGSSEYVQRIFEGLHERGWFGATRTRGPRPMRGASSLGALRVLRALRIDPIG